MEKGALPGHEFRALADSGLNAYALEYDPYTGTQHLRVISYNSGGEVPRITATISNFWGADKCNLVFVANSVTGMLFGWSYNGIVLVDVNEPRVAGCWYPPDSEFISDVTAMGVYAYVVGRTVVGNAHSQ